MIRRPNIYSGGFPDRNPYLTTQKRRPHRGWSDPDVPSALYGNNIKFEQNSPYIGLRLVLYDIGVPVRAAGTLNEYDLSRRFPNHRLVMVQDDGFGGFTWRSRPNVEYEANRLNLFLRGDYTIVAVAFF